MVDMRASSIVPEARGQLLDFYGWRLDDDDTGMLHMLLRDLPSSAKKGGDDDDEDEDKDEDCDDDEAATKPAWQQYTRSAVASGEQRAMLRELASIMVSPPCTACYSTARTCLNLMLQPCWQCSPCWQVLVVTWTLTKGVC
jgi:hypothetical protein